MPRRRIPDEHRCDVCQQDLGHHLHDEYHWIFLWNEGVFADRRAEIEREYEKRRQVREEMRARGESDEDEGGASLFDAA